MLLKDYGYILSSNLSLEARWHAVIDTACSNTVAGKEWMNDYMYNKLKMKVRGRTEMSVCLAYVRINSIG